MTLFFQKRGAASSKYGLAPILPVPVAAEAPADSPGQACGTALGIFASVATLLSAETLRAT